MKLICSLVLLILLTDCSFSQELNAELGLISPPPVLREGDVIEGLLKVWPIENANLQEFQKLESQALAKTFYVTSVVGVEVSSNNADVVEVKLLLIVKKVTEGLPEQFSYDGKILNVKIPPLNIAATGEAPADYYVLDQGLHFTNLRKIILIVCLIILLVAIFIKRNALTIFFKKFKEDPVKISKKKFNGKFIKASKREDFEEIYALRREWLTLNNELNSISGDFLKMMVQHQYKKSWNADILDEVTKSFANIRGSIK